MEVDSTAQVTEKGTVDWEEEFKHKPLSDVDLTDLKRDSSEEEVRKLAEVVIRFKHILSDGKLDNNGNVTPSHSTTCKIHTIVVDPKLMSTPRRLSPTDQKMSQDIVEEHKLSGLIEKSYAPWSSSLVAHHLTSAYFVSSCVAVTVSRPSKSNKLSPRA